MIILDNADTNDVCWFDLGILTEQNKHMIHFVA